MAERARLICDLPADVRMAIQLRSVKQRCTIGEVVEQAIRIVFSDDITEAIAVLAARKQAAEKDQS